MIEIKQYPTPPDNEKKMMQIIIDCATYTQQLERIIYDCVALREIMLTAHAIHSEEIYNRIIDKYESEDESDDE